MVTETFGAMLYSPESECIEEFPSPESLKKRVLISTKPPECLEVQNTMQKDQQRHKDSAEDEIRNTNFKKELGATDKVQMKLITFCCYAKRTKSSLFNYFLLNYH
jgi:hypothetical protein